MRLFYKILFASAIIGLPFISSAQTKTTTGAKGASGSTGAVKKGPRMKGKLILTPDMDCTVMFNEKPVGLIKAGKTKMVVGDFGENILVVTLGATAATPAKDAKTKDDPKGKKTAVPAGDNVFTLKPVISDTGRVEYKIEFTGRPMFLDFIRKGNVSMVTNILTKHPEYAKTDDEFDVAPILLASEKCNVELVKLLLDKGANVNAKLDWTPLESAIVNGKMEMVKMLVERGADVNDKDETGFTPLHFSVNYNKHEIMLFLLEKGANVNLKDNKGQTPLSIALAKGSMQTAEELKAKGAIE